MYLMASQPTSLRPMSDVDCGELLQCTLLGHWQSGYFPIRPPLLGLQHDRSVPLTPILEKRLSESLVQSPI